MIYFNDKTLLWMFILTYYLLFFIIETYLLVATFVLTCWIEMLSFSSVYSSNLKNKRWWFLNVLSDFLFKQHYFLFKRFFKYLNIIFCEIWHKIFWLIFVNCWIIGLNHRINLSWGIDIAKYTFYISILLFPLYTFHLGNIWQ